MRSQAFTHHGPQAGIGAMRLYRLLSALGALSMLSSCGLGAYLPRGPSLSPSARQAWLQQARQPVRYTGPPRVSFPVLPFQVFALHYEADMVVETSHPHWRLHEFARVIIGDQTIWIAKDADNQGVQTITASVPAISQWFPEVPVPRRMAALQVQDHSTAETLDMTFAYTNARGEHTVVDFHSPRPPQLARKRNGSTFNHSAQVAAAVLDIPSRQLRGVKAHVVYDGQPMPVRRLLGVVPIEALLTQTQAGFVITSMRLRAATARTLSVTRPIPGQPWPTQAHEVWQAAPEALQYHNETSAWQYHLVQGGVSAVTVSQVGKPQALLSLVLSAPLPDFSRPFAGTVTRHFVLDINGQTHGHGRMQASSHPDGATLAIAPVAPAWFAARPLQTDLRLVDAQTLDVVTRRIDVAPPAP